MKRQLAALVICGLAAVSICAGQAPSAGFIGDGPGVNAPFLDSVDFDTYGLIHSGDVSGWEFDGTGGTAVGMSYIRYRPTLAGETGHTAMPLDEDWVFEISVRQTGSYHEETPWYIKNEDKDLRIMSLWCTGIDNWTLQAADSSNNYVAVAENLVFGEDWADFVIHYKAATETLDAYLNGGLIASDFTVQLADVDWVQAEWLRKGWTSFRNFKLGQLSTGGPPCGPGDADEDGDVDDDDLSLLLANWGSETAGCDQGEFSDTPPVNDDDLSLLLANWTGPLSGAVPEPATMTLLALTGPVLLRFRRKA